MKEKYIILESSDAADLQYEINKQIKDGYIPTGGVCIVWGRNNYNMRYSQAMILKEVLT